ncbi:MAG: GNAT family N-acetyltransferase [Lentimicrobium sp.]|jgi:GNAT superfamily N-acetyltransferase|nr:GNAT family N-acetyltransferase [Lentimicrobium sp.]MDD2527982.1 GNAT family N-acetyltransferase [Lentimicrobiaceae bacterium]MDY0025661.1 GNAT family N-acetyltransferase [Lentimicrobium sp.]HAH58131.1 GNAT family N-acetyltransferase [Bacteroidales bacterium]
MSSLTSIRIKQASRHDIEFIVESQLKMAMETEKLALDRYTVMHGVTSVFSDSTKGFYIVAVTAEEERIACLMITPEWSDWRNAWMWWIQSVYVSPEWRKKGLFRKMYTYLKDRVNELEEVSGMRLYVDRKNTRAQEVYRSVGMNGDHYLTFEWMK